MDQALFETILQIVATLAITLIGVGGAWLTAKIAKKQELGNIAAATEQVIQAAQITVGELQQTIVDNMKVNGTKLTEAQISELGELLTAKTYAKLGAPALALLNAASVDIQALIRGAGEDWISKIKM